MLNAADLLDLLTTCGDPIDVCPQRAGWLQSIAVVARTRAVYPLVIARGGGMLVHGGKGALLALIAVCGLLALALAVLRDRRRGGAVA